jgi:hypothetical protein
MKMKNFHFPYLYETNKRKIMIEELKKVDVSQVGNIYTAKTLSEELGCSSRLIHYFRTTGKLKSITSGNARYYFRGEDVIDFLKEKGYEER